MCSLTAIFSELEFCLFNGLLVGCGAAGGRLDVVVVVEVFLLIVLARLFIVLS